MTATRTECPASHVLPVKHFSFNWKFLNSSPPPCSFASFFPYRHLFSQSMVLTRQSPPESTVYLVKSGHPRASAPVRRRSGRSGVGGSIFLRAPRKNLVDIRIWKLVMNVQEEMNRNLITTCPIGFGDLAFPQHLQFQKGH